MIKSNVAYEAVFEGRRGTSVLHCIESTYAYVAYSCEINVLQNYFTTIESCL